MGDPEPGRGPLSSALGQPTTLAEVNLRLTEINVSLADGGGASARGLTHGLGHRATGALATCSPSMTNTMLGAELEAQVCTPSASPAADPAGAPTAAHAAPLCTPLHPLRTS